MIADKKMAGFVGDRETTAFLLGRLGDGVIVTNARGLILQMNASARNLTRAAGSRLKRRMLGDVLDTDSPATRRWLQRFLAGFRKPGHLGRTWCRASIRGANGAGKVAIRATVQRGRVGHPPAGIVILRHAAEPAGRSRRTASDADNPLRYEDLLSVYEELNAGVYVVDPESYRVLYANRYMREHHAEIIGRSCWECLKSGRRGACSFCINPRELQSSSKGLRRATWEFFDQKLGKWFLCGDRDIASPDGRKIRLVIAWDISRLKETEESLRQALSEKESILNNAVVGIAYLKDWRPVWFNSQLESILGYTSSEMKSLSMSEWFSQEDDLQRIERDFREIQGRGQTFSCDCRLRRKDGTVFWASLGGQALDRQDLTRGAIWICRNIDARKRAEADTKESEERYRDLVELSSDAIVVTVDGIIEFINSAGMKMLGAGSAREVLGAPILRYVRADARQHLSGRFRLPSETGQLVTLGEERLVSADGAEFVAELSAVSTTYKHRPALQLIFRDISARKRFEKEIARSSEQERSRLGQDLRDVLGQELGGVAFLTRALEERLRKEAPAAAADAERIGQLVSRAMGNTKKLARGLYPPELLKADLGGAVETLARDQEELFGTRITVKNDCSSGVRGLDEFILQNVYRIIQDALANALRHSKGDHIWVTISQSADRFTVSVADNGRGIPVRTVHRRGMGINIMKHRANLIGGMLDIEKRPGGGAIVRCTVGVKPQPTAASGR